jgi:uncharacterized protein (TIGR03066 family)
LRLLAASAIVCLIGSAARAEEKIDYAKMIVGKWEVTTADEGLPKGSIVEFTKDGKLKVTGKKDETELSFDGTYKLEKNTFTFKIKVGEEEHSETITIDKISDKAMTTSNKAGKVVELTKKK